MSITNSILLTLNIKDDSIHFDENCVSEEKFKGIHSLIYEGTLSYDPPSCCPICGCINENHSIIKHGSKVVHVRLPAVSKKQTILRLHKQRFFCKHCRKTFSAQSNIVEDNCSISFNSRTSILLDAKNKISEKDIAKNNFVSHATVNSLLLKTYSRFIINKTHLPAHLCFDEFKSVKSVSCHMSFIFLDADTGNIVNILENRNLPHLLRFFFSYSREARMKVKTICMDMYSPYISLVKSCFPNADIIIDRFHIVQLLARSLNKTRIQLMKKDKKNYNKLKRYWKLILKRREDLEVVNFKSYTCFTKWMREIDIVDYLLSLDTEFENTYNLYQDLLSAIKHRKVDCFISSLKIDPSTISTYMQTSLETLQKYKNYIINALHYSYSNGVMEGTNNLIKVIKRIAFGYRSFLRFKIRILLISNTMIKLL